MTPPAAEPSPPPLFVGIDVAKDKLDLVASDDDRVRTFDNDAEGRRLLIDALGGRAPDCVVVESTGGYERPLLDTLLDAGLNVALVNPANVRAFARGLGVLAKTDALDARVLVKFAQLAAPRLLEKRSANRV
ncbi:MAG: transposase [Tepidisphaeraceae bacterium]